MIYIKDKLNFKLQEEGKIFKNFHKNKPKLMHILK